MCKALQEWLDGVEVRSDLGMSAPKVLNSARNICSFRIRLLSYCSLLDFNCSGSDSIWGVIEQNVILLGRDLLALECPWVSICLSLWSTWVNYHHLPSKVIFFAGDSSRGDLLGVQFPVRSNVSRGVIPWRRTSGADSGRRYLIVLGLIANGAGTML